MINIATSLAACEGSLFGTGFDKNFWIYRANLGTPIEVDYDDCLDLEFDYGYESLRRIFIQFKK